MGDSRYKRLKGLGRCRVDWVGGACTGIDGPSGAGIRLSWTGDRPLRDLREASRHAQNENWQG
jgi:hypothetical protein